MIHGRTSYFYALGHCWRALCFAFALTLHCFGQCNWSQSDVDYLLYRVDDIRTYTGAIDQQMDDVISDTSAIKFLLERIDDSSVDVVSAINHNTSSLSNLLKRLTFDSVNQLRVVDTGVLVKATSIDSKMDRLEYAINNLTNYMCYSSTYNSNIVSLLTSFYGGYYPKFFSGTPDQYAIYVQRLVELGDFSTLISKYGLWTAFPMEYFTKVSEVDLLGGTSGAMAVQLRNAFSSLYGSYGNGTRQKLRDFTTPYYYQYGTRQLTDTTLGISNVLALANQTGIHDFDDSLSTHTVYSGSGQPSTTTTNLFGRVSSHLGKTFGIYGEPAETNDVTEISSPELGSNKNQVLADNVSGSIQDGCSAINSVANGFVDSVFAGRNVSGKFVIPGFSLSGYDAGISDIEINPEDYSNSHVGLIWFFNAVRAFALLAFVISSLWRIVGEENKLNAPDPF